MERPNLTDAALAAGIWTHYGIGVHELEFLPLGMDSHAWVFRAQDGDGRAYFVKLRRGAINAAGLAVPHFLRQQGIDQVVAPLATRAGALRAELDGFRLIVYPFVVGEAAMNCALTGAQWTEYGAILGRIHATPPSPELARQMRQETFAPHRQWSRIAATLHRQVIERDFADPYEREVAAFWRSRHAEVGRILARAIALGELLRQRNPPCVLCHADIHTANVLVDADGGLHFVDWDETIIAPKERDLMFVVPTGLLTRLTPREEELFFGGYGDRAVDALALAYYRYEWVVQEIGAYGEQVFLAPGVGETTKADAAQRWLAQFDPDETVAAAYAADLPAW